MTIFLDSCILMIMLFYIYALMIQLDWFLPIELLAFYSLYHYGQ